MIEKSNIYEVTDYQNRSFPVIAASLQDVVKSYPDAKCVQTKSNDVEILSTIK